ncbi:TRAP transporter small permease subunit [Xanthobacter pseudotagetidis]|uniref:TRAP transporter small permease subunit n=1 Tax=Xanthobacter pseudotagetidis TaxID=3119911 RepID=UPI00372C62C9
MSEGDGSDAGTVLEAIASRIDRFTDGVGRVVAWLTFATVVVCFATVYLRYVFHIGEIWLQELYAWTHVAAITMGAGYVLMKGGFVRVDLLYARFSPRGKALVELFGTLFLMAPFLAMMAVSGWSFFHTSYVMNEASQWENGLRALWLLKGTLLLFVLTVGLQGIAVIARALAVLLCHQPAPAPVPALSDAP